LPFISEICGRGAAAGIVAGNADDRIQMEAKEIEVFSEISNYAIVRMPGRNFPGCVIQGDSLSILLNNAERVYSLAMETGNEELIGEAEELKDAIEERLDLYESVLRAHGIDLPYYRPPKL
jgi:hypothetical protein